MATCLRCGSPQLELRADSSLAECRACHLVFDASRPRPMARRPRERSEETPIEQVPLEAPPGMEAIETRSGARFDYRAHAAGSPPSVEIRHPWSRLYGGRAAAAVLSLLLSAAYVVTVYRRDVDVFAVVALVALLVVPGYVAMAMLWNTMVVRVGGGWLVLKHGPVPWWGGKRIEAARVEQLYTEHYRWTPLMSRYERAAFRVMVRLRGEHMPRPLLEEVEDATHALYVEKTVERVLGLEDVPVFGELGYRMQIKGP